MRNLFGCTQEVFAQISGVSIRNVVRWENAKSKPNSHSKKVINKLDELCKKLVEIFNDADKISRWLNTPNKSLDGRTPIKQIVSAHTQEEGIQQIVDLLNGYEWGVAS